MADNTYTPPSDGSRDLNNRGLSTNIPKSNIVRIEVLDGNSRQRYLGGLQRSADIDLKTKIYQKISSKEDNIFYGFVNEGGSVGLNLIASWSNVENGGALMRVARSIAATGTQVAVGALGAVGGFVAGGRAGLVSGAAKGGSAGKSLVGGISDISNDIGNIVNELAGVSGSSTGGGTVKTFKQADLQDFTIKCGWYLPEQYNLCTKSLKILYRMAYPKQLDIDKDLRAKDFTDATINLASRAVAVVSDNTIGKVADKFGFGSTEDNPNEKTVQNQPSSENKKQDDASQGGLLQGALDSYLNISKELGSNFTFNPLPIRVCIGQYMDVEPLVITGVNTTFSKETFVNSDGRHLPIFVDTTIQFKFWLTPAPNLNFINILGEEVFGQSNK